MLIREVIKKNKGYAKNFVYHHLVESVRTPNGPRQRLILSLGTLSIPKPEWKALANRIEEILSGQEIFLAPPKHIEEMAQHFANIIIRKKLNNLPQSTKDTANNNEKQWETVDLASLSNSETRTIGGEAIGHKAFCDLGIPDILKNINFTPEQISQVELLIVGRLLHPASERETLRWGKDSSALGELAGADFTHLSNNSLYRISDKLIENKDIIEEKLAANEKNLLGLNEKIILYDLTNTYFEGNYSKSEKAKYGRSKEKRSDCPLMTLALVIDEDGFPKSSRVFSGNVSEPGTLKDILSGLNLYGEPTLFDANRTVVLDAGIATKENLQLLKDENYHYICVSRVRPKDVPSEGLQEIETGSGAKIQVKKIDNDGETFLFCQSPGREAKENGMKTAFMGKFEEGLKTIESSIKNPRGKKSFSQIMERIGRLKEKYSMVSRFYTIDVKQEGEMASSMAWKLENEKELDIHFNGSYYIRSDRIDLSESELWHLYTMLTRIEDAFRCLKTDLGLRPNYHHKDSRMESHLFITILAYHLLAFVQRQLRANGIHNSWRTIINTMNTQVRITTSVTNSDGKRTHLRNTSMPEECHTKIYKALKMPAVPLRVKKMHL